MKKVFVTALCLLAVTTIPLCAAPQYKIVDLGVLPGTVISECRDINDAGQVTGLSMLPNSVYKGFIWSEKNGMAALPCPDGVDVVVPEAMNDLGQIVGYGASDTWGSIAVMWDKDGSAKVVQENADAMGINDHGEISGLTSWGACVWDAAGNWTDIGRFDGDNWGYGCDINNSGKVAGYSSPLGGPARAFVWTKETGKVPLPTPEAGYSAYAMAMNEAGDVAGNIARLSGGDAFGVVWKADGSVRTLRQPEDGFFWVYGINDHGQVAGQFNAEGAIWNPDGSVVTLGKLPGGGQSCAYAINNRGWVAGFSYGDGQYQHAVIWKPASTTVEIDIKPGDSANVINLKSKGTTPVAVLGAKDFDVKTIDISTIAFADAPVKLKPNGKPMASYEDVNNDGRADLVLHFSTQDLKLCATNTSACLTGQCLDGSEIEGTDSVAVR